MYKHYTSVILTGVLVFRIIHYTYSMDIPIKFNHYNEWITIKPFRLRQLIVNQIVPKDFQLYL